MKLYIDDIRGAPDSSWTVARTVTEAIRYIAQYDFEVISLDHDISHYSNLDESDVDQEVRACDETFAAVAYYIGTKYLWHLENGLPIPKIILHTSNPVGGDAMAEILKDAGITCEKKYTGVV